MASKVILRNIVANGIGQFVYPLLSLLFVPIFIHYLGLEAYGLVGFFSLVVTLLGFFGDGLGAAIQREFARRGGDPEKKGALYALLRTFEIVYGLLGGMIGIGLGIVSVTSKASFLNTQTITDETARICLLIISVSIALRFPLSVYQAALNGLQEQVVLNILNGMFALSQALIGLLVVIVWKSVVLFYVSGLAVTILQVLFTRHWSYRKLPQAEHQTVILPRKEIQGLISISNDLIWINGMGLLISQTDRVVITWLLPLSILGVYTVVINGARLLAYFYGPFLTATYPELCQQSQIADREDFNRLLLRNAKVVMSIGVSIGLTIAFFSREILAVWARDATVIAEGWLPLSICVAANVFISYASVLYHGLLALGRTRYNVWFNVVAMFWYPVLMWWAVSKMDLLGAALSWLVYCVLAWLCNILLISRLHSKDILRTYTTAFVKTTAVGLFFSLFAHHLALHFFPSQIWPRLSLGILNGLIVGAIAMLMGFGLSFPKEVVRLLMKNWFK